MERYIKGVGMTKFGVEDRTTHSLAFEAAQEALNDSDIGMNDIDAAVVSTVDTKVNDERQRHYSSLLASILLLTRTKIGLIFALIFALGYGAFQLIIGSEK